MVVATQIAKKKAKFDNNNYFTFNTRRNRKTSLTEYYDLVYEYKNDCLTAGVHYKKTYYSDRDIKPNEDLLFTITLFPLTTFEQKVEILVLLLLGCVVIVVSPCPHGPSFEIHADVA